MDLTLDDARALVNDALLWPRVRDFLWDFAPQIHASWLPELPVDEALKNSPRVKSWLLETLSVEPCLHLFPKEDMSRIALLDGATLLELVCWLGVLHHAPSLRRVTGGAQVRALKAALPAAYPGAFRYTAYFRSATDDGAAAPSPADVLSTGMGILLAALKDAPAPVVARLRKKLPRELSGASPAKEAPLAGDLARLLKLKFREAYALCC